MYRTSLICIHGFASKFEAYWKPFLSYHLDPFSNSVPLLFHQILFLDRWVVAVAPWTVSAHIVFTYWFPSKSITFSYFANSGITNWVANNTLSSLPTTPPPNNSSLNKIEIYFSLLFRKPRDSPELGGAPWPLFCGSAVHSFNSQGT